MPTDLSAFGVQSYCYRHFTDPGEMAKQVKASGYDAIELCGVQADFQDTASHSETIKKVQDQGVSILSIGVEHFAGDEANDRNLFEFVKAAGAKYISAHIDLKHHREAIDVAAKLCEEYGVRVAIHNHGGYMWHGSEDAYYYLFDFAPKSIGLCMDTAWCLQTGRHKPEEWASKFADRLYGIHYNDFVFDRAAAWSDVVVGEGNLDLPALIAQLRANAFDGYAVVEYEADVESPVPALTRCREAMLSVMAD